MMLTDNQMELDSEDYLRQLLDPTYKPDRSLKCTCGWTGTMDEAKERWISTNPYSWMTLAGREGYEYFCPLCNRLITTHYTRMS